MTADIRPRFPGSGAFFAELRKRVAAHFEQTGQSTQDSPGMYLKTAVIFAWLLGSYLLLLLWAKEVWQGALLSISLGLSMAGVGFDIQHDANHGGYSRHKWINTLLAHSLDAVGGSSYVWHWKHNVIHHTYSNIAGVDADIDVGPFARLAPNQARRPLHRFQHFYLWALYGLLPVKWHFFDDFHDLAAGTIGTQKFPRPSRPHVGFILAMKAFFYTWALVIPIWLHPLWKVAGACVVTSAVLGVTLAVVFQLAHCVGEAEFPMPEAGTGKMQSEWAEHQVRTTVDFARNSKVLTWFLGGLNFQVEHHLFPKICHMHYPAISPIVEATCAEFGVPYRAHPTFRAALNSHARWLKQMGNAEAQLPAGLPGLPGGAPTASAGAPSVPG